MAYKHKRKRHIGTGVACTLMCGCIAAAGACLCFADREDRTYSLAEEVVVDLKDKVVIEDQPKVTPDPDVMLAEGDGIDIMDEAVPTAEPEADVQEDYDPMDRIIDWDELAKVNSDIFAWILLPGTNIDYPLLQEQTVGESFYLSHDYTGAYSAAGSLFVPASPLDLDDAHMLVFGHHMADKRLMFSQLKNYYKNADACEEHKYVYIYYPDRTERWAVWSAASGTKDDIVYDIPYTLGSDGYQDLIDDIESKSVVTDGRKPSKLERILVLTTCDGASGTSNRYYVTFRMEEAVMNEAVSDANL